MPFVALSTGAKTAQHVRRRFKEWFDASGQTQKAAGRAIEWEQQTVSSYFTGDQQIDLIRAIAWCDYFGKSVEELLDTSPQAKPNDPGRQAWISAYDSQDVSGRKMLSGFVGTIQGTRTSKGTSKGRGRRS